MTSHVILDCFYFNKDRQKLFNDISNIIARFKTLSREKKLNIILNLKSQDIGNKIFHQKIEGFLINFIKNIQKSYFGV